MKFTMNITEPIKSNELMLQLKERGLFYTNSTITCGRCKAIFPIEYINCPQCEVDDSWQIIKIQYKNNFGGK